MADDAASDPIESVGKIEFIQFHKPQLLPGEYRITVTQEIQTTNNDQRIPLSKFPATRNFLALGDRCELKPEDIFAVFPPDGSLGDHSNVLPHVALNRSTLPWERTPWGAGVSGSGDAPWLLLLLFDQEEQPETQVTTLGQLKAGINGEVKFPAFTLEPGQQDADKIAVIDVKKSVLQGIAPAPQDLPFLAHVRQTKDADGKPDAEERAVIIGHRLPRRGALSAVHLVSVEGRYKSDGFDYQGAGDEDSIRLISLKSWRFACANEIHSFKGLLVNLNRRPGALRLPQNASPEAERRLAQGYVPLPHWMRQGEQTVSWYHGPLIPVENPVEPLLPARSADELARYDAGVGLFDVSYAAAWELGRLLALQSKQFSVRLYHWKRAHAQHLKQDEQRLLHPHLPTSESAPDAEPLSDELAKWFRDLSLLHGVPFNYLVPDERMLPPESIRFFWLDPAWVDCLLDGAFSIGRVTSAAQAQDQAHEVSPASNPHARLSGFLLRSDVVSGWPGLLVDAYDSGTNGKKIDRLRMDRLSDNVLLCLFAGEAQVVEIHQQPEALHFGLDETMTAPSSYFKKLRDSQGVEGQLTVAAIPWRQAEKRAIDISSLAQAIENNLDSQTRSKLQLPPMTSAQFALQMIEGVEKVVLQAGRREEAKAAVVSVVE
jgi:hypothetical protein